MEQIDKDIEKQSKEVVRLIKVTTFNTDKSKMQNLLKATCGNFAEVQKLYAKKIEQNT